MRIDLIPAGANPPHEINVLIEVPIGGEPVKYEFDKESGALFVDRILHTPMRYPANYGFIPHTLSDDGDPLDALVIARSPFVPGCVVRARPLGVLKMTDEKGGDAKILAVPIKKECTQYDHIESVDQMSKTLLARIAHFFQHYKDLDSGKWVRIDGWGNVDEAKTEVMDSVERYNKGH